MLKNMRIAVLVADGFEQSEMIEPKKALEAAGAQVLIISPKPDKVKSWNNGNWSDSFNVDILVDNTNSDDFNGLLLPGGVLSADALRINQNAVNVVKRFVEQDKPIAVICHGPWILIEAQAIKERKITSWPSLKSDLINAKAIWFDEKVIVDSKHNLVSSRKPKDIPYFNDEMIKLFNKYWQLHKQL